MENRSRLPIFILIGVLVILLMIPISAILINPMESDPLNTPIFELGDMSLNEMFGTDHLDDEFNALNDYTINELFNLTSLIDSDQLVTNGDFSDDTTGWSAISIGTPTITNGIVSLTATAQNGRLIKSITVIPNNKYYIVSRIKSTWIRFGFYGTVNIISSDIGSTSFALYSNIFTPTSTPQNFGIYDSRTSGWTQIDVDYMYNFNITSLINNLYYSPLYDTSFNLLNDTQIKTQMDDFVSYPYKFIDYATLGVEITDDQWEFLNNYYTDWYAFDTDLYMFLYAGLSLTADQWQYYYNLYTYYSSL